MDTSTRSDRKQDTRLLRKGRTAHDTDFASPATRPRVRDVVAPAQPDRGVCDSPLRLLDRRWVDPDGAPKASLEIVNVGGPDVEPLASARVGIDLELQLVL
jgi:hypothetical protein